MAPKPNPDLKALVNARRQPVTRPTYIANPYSHPIPEIMQARLACVAAVLHRYTGEGKPAFAPVYYTQQMQENGAYPPQGWYHYDLSFLAVCESMTLLCIPGFQESSGVQLEIAAANMAGIPVIEVPWPAIAQLIGKQQTAVIEIDAVNRGWMAASETTQQMPHHQQNAREDRNNNSVAPRQELHH